MKTWISWSFFFLAAFFVFSAEAQMPGFVSINCGSTENFTDELGLRWITDPLMYGEVAHLSVANETRRQYKTLRHFPPDDRKYCYTLEVEIRTRYLLRASFLYGNYDSNNVYPKFDISVGATPWSTVLIMDPNEVVVLELIFLALEPTVSLCLSNASTGTPFISTLELRQFNGSMYYTNYETQFYLGVSARINFGADSKDPVRYPDDPYDRIWESDSLKKANYLVDVAAGTEAVSTNKPINTNIKEMPPQRVMQTAVVGRNGSLSYRSNLEGFPAQGWTFCYFAEIEELGSHDVRKFRLNIPVIPGSSVPVFNIIENVGKYSLYEPGFPNVTLPYTLTFGFNKTADSTLGPIVNAIEASSYIKRSPGSSDGSTMASFVSHYSTADWAQEGGDPCLPVPWSWLKCNSDSQPLITKVKLSGKNLTGNIPSELTQLSGLEELWLGGNSLTGSIPDFSGCPNLKIIHLEDNQLNGKVPSSLTQLANLKELYLQDNQLSGELPSALLDRNLIFNYTGNIDLNEGGGGGSQRNMIIGVSVGVSFLILAAIVGCILLCRRKKPRNKFFDHGVNMGHGISVQELSSSSVDPTPETAHCFSALEIEEATRKFERKIGSGGFGVVYYGKLQDGREIAVKVLTSNSYQSQREFSNEVTLLSRIHHRNLLQFLGYCQEDGISILVYEFMHNGTLKENLYGPLIKGGQTINWVKRLEIAEDSARGTEYLHSGCVPSIIHRDLKTCNILLDKNMRAKVSDFGLSKFKVDGESHVSSMVRGTIGYLDPEYYISQKLTTKSDVYSFGVILLELISGQEVISNLNFDDSCCNIIDWAKLHIEKGDLQKIIDPALQGEYDIQSMWKIAEEALMCVLPNGNMRPSMAEVLKEIQEAILIERERDAVRSVNSSDDIVSRQLLNSPAKLAGLVNLGPGENHVSVDTSMEFPEAR